MIHGRVLDCSGNPAAAVAIEYQIKAAADRPHPRPRAVSLADGSFTMPTPDGSGHLVAVDENLTTVLAGLVGDRPVPSEIVVVVAPRVEVLGRVVDESSAALAGVQVSIDLPKAFRARFDAILDRSLNVERHTTTDANGAFELRDAAAVDGSILLAALDGFDRHDEPLPPGSVEGHVIVLTRPSSKDGLVRGRVVDVAGQPMGGARVSFGIDTTVTSDTGEFVFKLEDPKSMNVRFHYVPRALVALKRGFLPGRYEPPAREGVPSWPAWVTVRLADKPLAISGRVVDANDRACRNVWVWIVDATMFGAVGDGPAQVENVLAGAESEFFHYVTTDDAGRFTIDGLLDRAYHVQAMDPGTLIRVDVGPIDAGKSDLELRLPTNDVYPRVAGRVVTHRGRPVSGVHVIPMCDTFRAKLEGQTIGTSHQTLGGVATDGDGRFEMKNIPKSLVYIRLEGPTLIPLEYGRYWDDDPAYANAPVKGLPKDRIDSLEIVVDQRCHFQVELADPTAGDEVAVLDAAGHELIINVFHGNGREEREHIAVVDGRTPAMAASDAGRTLVLFKAGAEVARQPVDLEPGELRHIRL
ncbi:MAG: carboxypeptidase regulatory-like domain-containing protein [Planctomycetes bacterium]|nr:carboxypeptidase regulatory-like domain-containing protein [Planctomycetota bacterium]